jgi:hypothetical protein
MNILRRIASLSLAVSSIVASTWQNFIDNLLEAAAHEFGGLRNQERCGERKKVNLIEVTRPHQLLLLRLRDMCITSFVSRLSRSRPPARACSPCMTTVPLLSPNQSRRIQRGGARIPSRTTTTRRSQLRDPSDNSGTHPTVTAVQTWRSLASQGGQSSASGLVSTPARPHLVLIWSSLGPMISSAHPSSTSSVKTLHASCRIRIRHVQRAPTRRRRDRRERSW